MSGARDPLAPVPTASELDQATTRAEANAAELEEAARHVAALAALGKTVGRVLLEIATQVLTDVATGALLDVTRAGEEFHRRAEERRARHRG